MQANFRRLFKMNKRIWILTVALFAPTLASAHTLTVDYSGQPPQIALAHNGAFDPVAPARIAEVAAVDRRGKALPTTATASGNGTVVSSTGRAPAGAVWVSYAGLPSGTTATGERRPGPKGTHADAVNVGRSQVFALAVNHPATPLAGLPTGRIALIPVSPLTAARTGSTLKVGAIYAGAPMANATIRLDALTLEQGGATIITDANGEADIPLGAAGRRLFAVSRAETPSSDPTVDTLRLQASLGFTVLPAR
jgi:Domain of unknown function (DUF4198)